MRRAHKIAVLRVARRLGIFRVARLATARQLRILCYHGVGSAEDVAFEPGLFMTLERLRRRFEILRRGRFDVLALEDAVAALRSGQLPRSPVVITFDDGLFGNLAASRALCREFAFPMTLYVTTYYVLKQTPIFRLAVKYMLWKSSRTTLSLKGLSEKLSVAAEHIDLSDRGGAAAALWNVIRQAETMLSENERVSLARELGVRLGVDYDALAAERRLSLLSSNELAELSKLGVDIQLHTHRHWMPTDPVDLRREIEDNRAVLMQATGQTPRHLCYPSGAFAVAQWPTLLELDVRSATTCEPGLNGPDTPPLRLARFLDTEQVTDIEFEAELCGALELGRRLRQLLRGRRPAPNAVEPAAYGH